MEENANLVVRLLIRRPECLGPALRGEGGGLLKAMQDGILMSLQIASARDPEMGRYLRAVTEEEDDDRGNYLMQGYDLLLGVVARGVYWASSSVLKIMASTEARD